MEKRNSRRRISIMGDCDCDKKYYLDELIEKAYEVMQEEYAVPLTTKQRKKMKSGTFCGPNRSFE
jgi:hypothetical protein